MKNSNLNDLKYFVVGTVHTIESYLDNQGYLLVHCTKFEIKCPCLDELVFSGVLLDVTAID